MHPRTHRETDRNMYACMHEETYVCIWMHVCTCAHAQTHTHTRTFLLLKGMHVVLVSFNNSILSFFASCLSTFPHLSIQLSPTRSFCF